MTSHNVGIQSKRRLESNALKWLLMAVSIEDRILQRISP